MTALIIFQVIVLIFSIVIHEVSHGYVADSLGDPTARRAGRLTLNPIKHLDVFGSFIVPLLLIISNASFIVGWAKPVPYNPNLLRDKKYGPLKVALAGPLSNLVIASFFGIFLRFAHGFLPEITIVALGFIVFLNILLAVFNLIPIPPLDGSKILTVILPPKYSMMVQRIGLVGIFLVLIFLMYFGNFIFGFTGSIFKFLTGPEVWQIFVSML
jgi:Zn-dependent protease